MEEARGTPGNFLTGGEVKDKYRQCIKGIQSKKEMEKTIEMLGDLENLKKISTLADLLRGAPRR